LAASEKKPQKCSSANEKYFLLEPGLSWGMGTAKDDKIGGRLPK
jgi:hypothetical protein